MAFPATRIVLVEPQIPGNLGAVARAMANFGQTELCLFRPCPIDDEAFRRAKGGRKILENAKIGDSLDEMVEGTFVVGTTGYAANTERIYRRVNWTPEQMRKKATRTDLPISLLFGREDYGLYNHEIELCDACVTIPTDPNCPIMNLSHAVAVVLYELYSEGLSTLIIPSPDDDKKRLMSNFEALLDAVEYPPHRKRNTSVMFQRLVGRSVLTRYEYHTLVGVLKDASALRKIDNPKATVITKKRKTAPPRKGDKKKTPRKRSEND